MFSLKKKKVSTLIFIKSVFHKIKSESHYQVGTQVKNTGPQWCNRFEIYSNFTFIYPYSIRYTLWTFWPNISRIIHDVCIRSCTENPSHGFLTSGWFVHNWFVDLDNSFEVIVHHLLIRGMIGLSHWDEVPMVSALICIVTHWTRPTMSHVIRLSSSHDFTKLLQCIVSQHWENIEFVQNLTMVLTYDEILKWSYIPYGLGHY